MAAKIVGVILGAFCFLFGGLLILGSLDALDRGETLPQLYVFVAAGGMLMPAGCLTAWRASRRSPLVPAPEIDDTW